MTLERSGPRIDQLREALQAYERTALETDRLLRQCGRDLMAAFSTYLHPKTNLVRGVPPDGEWKPDTDYGDAVFGGQPDGRVRIRPVELGMAVRIDRPEGQDALWVRVVLTLRKGGGEIRLSVGDKASMDLPLDYRPELPAACEMIFQTVLRQFTEDREYDLHGDYSGDKPIGFRLMSSG